MSRHLRMRAFFGPYFTQDLLRFDRSPRAAVHRYVRESGAKATAALISDLETVLLRNREPEGLRALLDELGCDYDPESAGTPIRDWVSWVHDELEAALVPPAPKDAGIIQLRLQR